MAKVCIKLRRPVYPSPAALIVCIDKYKKPNIITLGEVFNLSIDKPALLGIAVRQTRYSYQLIKKSREFTVNFPTAEICRKVDLCGTISGKKVDKFKEYDLTPIQSSIIKTPLIKECRINLECKVKKIIKTGDHDLFIAEILASHIDENLLNGGNKINVAELDTLCYIYDEYWNLAQRIGEKGFSRQFLLENQK